MPLSGPPVPSLILFPPGHPDGHPLLWLWQICSLNDIEMSGSSDDRSDALDMATSALDEVMMGREQ